MEVTLYKDLTWVKIGDQISTFNKQNEMYAHLKKQFFFLGGGKKGSNDYKLKVTT